MFIKTIEKVISSYRVNAIYVNYCKIKKRVEKMQMHMYNIIWRSKKELNKQKMIKERRNIQMSNKKWKNIQNYKFKILQK